MKKFYALVLLTLLYLPSLFAQCSEQEKPRVLLVGDSWAFFMSVDGTINNALKKWGHSNYKFVSNTVVAENGAQTDDFLTATKQNEIKKLLDQNPTIKVVHLSIGGNDVLGSWKVSFSQGKTDTLKQEVANRLIQVIDFIKTCKPGIKILWSGYCYPNFGEVIPTSSLGTNHPFYGTWQKMEFPDFFTINTLLNSFSKDVDSFAKTEPQVEFVNATGLMQYTFGQTQPLGVAPGGTYPAFSVPLPEGDPNYPSPKSSMRDYLLTKDCFHLSAKGYLDLIEYHTQKFYHKFLMDDIYFLNEGNGESGTVTSNGNVFDSLVLGESNGEKFNVALSFNTRSMADTSLSKASIFLRRKSLSGNNPISNTLEVKVKNGNFGTSAIVEASDYSDAGDANGTPCLFGSNGGDGHWIRLDLPANLFPYINNSASTQFVISAPNATGGQVVFNDLSNPDFAPVLNLTYFNPTVGIEDVKSEKKLSVYPNPVNQSLYVNTNFLVTGKAEIYNLLGMKVSELSVITGEPIDVADLKTGVYYISVKTTNGTISQKFLKE
jgi:lysophospholipase L1-like esterase